MKKIPNPIATAAVGMLEPYYPGLTVNGLEAALAAESGPKKEDDLITRQEACAALHISVVTLDRMLNEGELGRVKIRRRVFVRASSVRAIIEGRKAA